MNQHKTPVTARRCIRCVELIFHLQNHRIHGRVGQFDDVIRHRILRRFVFEVGANFLQTNERAFSNDRQSGLRTTLDSEFMRAVAPFSEVFAIFANHFSGGCGDAFVFVFKRAAFAPRVAFCVILHRAVGTRERIFIIEHTSAFVQCFDTAD